MLLIVACLKHLNYNVNRFKPLIIHQSELQQVQQVTHHQVVYTHLSLFIIITHFLQKTHKPGSSAWILPMIIDHIISYTGNTVWRTMFLLFIHKSTLLVYCDIKLRESKSSHFWSWYRFHLFFGFNFCLKNDKQFTDCQNICCLIFCRSINQFRNWWLQLDNQLTGFEKFKNIIKLLKLSEDKNLKIPQYTELYLKNVFRPQISVSLSDQRIYYVYF